MGYCSSWFLPHGRLSLYAIFMGIATYLFVVSSTFGCYFLEANASLSSDYPEILFTTGNTGSNTMIHAGFGLYSYEDAANLHNNDNDSAEYWACYAYEPEQLNQLDGKFNAARIFGFISNILIAISVLWLLTLTCLHYHRIALVVLACMLIMAGVLQTLTFLFFASDFCHQFQCAFYAGAGAAVAATFCSFLTAFMVLGLPDHHHDDATLSNDPYYNQENGSNSLPDDRGKRQPQERGEQSFSETGSRRGQHHSSRKRTDDSSEAASSLVDKMTSASESDGSRRHDQRGSSFDDEDKDGGRSKSSRRSTSSEQAEKRDLV
jgi:hypothetical protein